MAGANLHLHRIVPLLPSAKTNSPHPPSARYCRKPHRPLIRQAGHWFFYTIARPSLPAQVHRQRTHTFRRQPRKSLSTTQTGAAPMGTTPSGHTRTPRPALRRTRPSGSKRCGLRPDGDPLILAERLLSASALPVEEWRTPLARELRELLQRCGQSA